jgi:hypothetical protein
LNDCPFGMESEIATMSPSESTSIMSTIFPRPDAPSMRLTEHAFNLGKMENVIYLFNEIFDRGLLSALIPGYRDVGLRGICLWGHKYSFLGRHITICILG